MTYSRQEALSGALKEMTRSSALSAGHVEDAARIIAEKGCLALRASRVSVWRIEEGAVLKNIATYRLLPEGHTVLEDLDLSRDGRRYFELLTSEKLLVVDDAARPNALTGISGAYGPRICAMLDAPIRVDGRLAGVICVAQDTCDAYPGRREWAAEERGFVSSLADFMEIAMISGEHRTLALRNEEIMENMPGAIYQCLNDPPRYTVTYVSQGIGALTGYAPKAFVGAGMSKLSSLIHPDDVEQSHKTREETLIKGQPMEAYFRILLENGAEKWVWERSKAAKTAPDGRPLLFEGFFTDVTEQRRREIAEAANEAKSAFLAQMSHEMRTPLSAVISLSGLLLESADLGRDAEVYLDKIYNAGSTLLGIVNDILDISKIEAGKIELLPQEYDVAALINDAVAQNILRVQSKPVRFALDISENTPARLHGDDIRVKQVLSNLLSNAFKYTAEGMVELRVDCEPEGDTVWTAFRVSDTGIGIRPEDMNRLFSDYTRFDGEVNRKTGGTGLGLSITRRLAELMDGGVTVTSEYGAGSVFTARFRQRFVDDVVIGVEMAERLRHFRYTEGRRRAGSQLDRVRMPGARVLVVDDNLTNLDIARGLMRPYGMAVDCVTGGQAAVEALRNEDVRYDAVFMDHMMPGMDGVEAMRVIREEIGTEYARTVPVIALTANAVVGSKERFISQGFNSFVSKPIDIFRLDAEIRQWVWAKYKEREERETGAERRRTPDRRVNDRRTGDDRRVGERRSGEDRRSAVPPPAVAVEGLDWAAGTELFGGEEAFCEILRSFAVNTRPLLDGLRAVSADGLPGYAITVHGIKSAARGIRARALGDMAATLELAAKDGDWASVSRGNAGFIDMTGTLIDGIEARLGKAAADARAAKPGRERPEGAELLRLRAACEAYDLDGIEAAMRAIDGYEYTDDGGLAAWLQDSVTRLDYAAVAQRLAPEHGRNDDRT